MVNLSLHFGPIFIGESADQFMVISGCPIATEFNVVREPVYWAVTGQLSPVKVNQEG